MSYVLTKNMFLKNYELFLNKHKMQEPAAIDPEVFLGCMVVIHELTQGIGMDQLKALHLPIIQSMWIPPIVSKHNSQVLLNDRRRGEDGIGCV